ncbi:MAG: alpha/beta fold hydrolase [Betaproteobacteria bacterium]|nr:alpha/beta fold hydrolase [Betaproteobacteria bacterium]
MTHLLFLHGLGGGHHAWDAQLPYFAERGYAAHAWDQPGYGHTPIVEPYTLENVSAALKRLIDTFQGEPIVLLGHSMGGMVAQETFARYPGCAKALVLGFTSPAFGGGSAEFVRQFVAARLGPLDEGKTMAELAASLMPKMRGSKSDPAGLAHAEKIMSGIAPGTYRKAVELLTTFDRKRELKDISVPTLLICGSDDRTAPPPVMERMAKEISGADFVRLEGCGHLGPMDQPREFNVAVEVFLRKNGL